MGIRNLLLGIFITAIAVSCKKETTTDNNEVRAATLLNFSYGAAPLQNMDVYLPAGRATASTKVMILIHGGAWAIGDKADFASFVDSLKRRLPAYAIFNINYRLSAFPDNVFPTQEMDVKTAVEYIYSKRAEYLISDNFTMVGASAGAHLSLLHAYKYATPVKIKAVVDFFGPTDMTDLYNNPGTVPQSTIAAIVGATPASNSALYQQSSPINFATIGAACPTIILQGSADPLVNAVRQSGALKNKLQAAGVPVQYVEYAGKGHGDDWYSDTFFDAFNKIQAFLALYNP
jgi:acetyl esterase/lipase